MGHVKGDHVESKRYIRIFLILCIQSCICLQSGSVYQPKAYHSVTDIKGKTLYPGDSFIHTYTEVYCNDQSQPVAGTMITLEVPVIDSRFFHIEQLGVTSSVTSTTHFNYNITLKCTVKEVTKAMPVTVASFVTYNTDETELWEPPAQNNFDHQVFSIPTTVAPLSSGISSSVEQSLPDFVGEIFTLKDINNKDLYAGDVIKIEKLMTTQRSDTSGLGMFEYIFLPYREFMDLYQDPVTDYVLDKGWHKSETDFYYVIKDTLPKKYTLSVMLWKASVGTFSAGAPHGFEKLSSVAQITINPVPDFFRLLNNNPDLRKVLQKYVRSKQGCTSNALDADKRTPLMWSIFYGQADLVKHFLSDPLVSLVGKDKDGRTPLIYAAERNNLEIARLLLAKDSAYQALPLQDKDGMAMLHYAVWNNNYSMVQSILAAKSVKNSVNDVTIHGVTPLMYAAAQGNKQLVQLLLDNKADYTIVDKNGFDCLFYACMSLNIDFVKYLYGYILADDKAMAQTMLNAVALDKTNLIYNTLLAGKTDDDFYEIIQFLLGQGLQPDSGYDANESINLQLYLQTPSMQRGVYGTVFALACSRGAAAKKTIQLLLQKGARVTAEAFTVAQNNGVSTVLTAYSQAAGPALYQALYKGDTMTASYIANQFDASLPVTSGIVNYTNNGWSVLFLLAAQAQGNTVTAYNAVANALIQRGANVNIVGPDAQGNPATPLVWAVNNGNAQLQTLLQTGGSKLSQAVVNTITMDSAVAGANSSTGKKAQTQPSGLVSGGTTQMSGIAIPENVISYDSVEYLLG